MPSLWLGIWHQELTSGGGGELVVLEGGGAEDLPAKYPDGNSCGGVEVQYHLRILLFQWNAI